MVPFGSMEGGGDCLKRADIAVMGIVDDDQGQLLRCVDDLVCNGDRVRVGNRTFE